jgi:hypothetical protein
MGEFAIDLPDCVRLLNTSRVTKHPGHTAAFSAALPVGEPFQLAAVFL